MNDRNLLLNSGLRKRIYPEPAHIVALERSSSSGEPRESRAGAEVPSEDASAAIAVADEKLSRVGPK
jgi:hypothetical protein